mmetsp:Transcript_11398/g.34863  ORF Transcript_11398/g.34863 Transcript_11398/m.34863 type:complete len:94 (+) Transcript_11398:1013-1294(+)
MFKRQVCTGGLTASLCGVLFPRYADLIVPRGGDNHVAINLIVQHIAMKLQQEGDLRKLYPNLYRLRDSSQIRGLHTIFRRKDACREVRSTAQR